MKRFNKRIWMFLLLFVISFSLIGCKNGTDDIKDDGKLDYDYTDLSVRDYESENGIVTAANPYAAKVGLDILMDGGNAYDAAVGVAFALGVAEPNASGLSGGGILVGYSADQGKYVSYNFREFVPAAGNANAFPNQQQDTRDGIKSSGVPTQVAGLLKILTDLGTKDRQEILEPVIKLADEGVIITPELGKAISDSFSKIMRSRSETLSVFTSDGFSPIGEGELLVQKDYAKVLQKISDEGLDGFYTGEVADAIVKLMEDHGGLITHQDLLYAKEEYPIIETPLQGNYRDFDIVTVNTPSSGGITLIQTLNMLEQFGDISKLDHNSAEYLHVVATAMQLAYGDKRRYVGDRNFVDVPVNGLISKLYAAERWEKFNPDKAYLGRNQGDKDYGDPWPYDSSNAPLFTNLENDYEEHFSTTAFSVADKYGNIASITQTINYFFGNGLVPEGCGFFMNNELSSFSFNRSGASYIEPLKQPVSHIMPTIIMKDGDPFATIGSPGSMRIPSAVIQVVLNMIDFDMDIQTAINMPRVYNYAVGPDETYSDKKDLYVERGILEADRKILAQKGYNIIVKGSNDIDLYFGGAHGIRFYPSTGKIHGGADPRRDGKALGY